MKRSRANAVGEARESTGQHGVATLDGNLVIPGRSPFAFPGIGYPELVLRGIVLGPRFNAFGRRAHLRKRYHRHR